ncbi:MAG: presqualene diphosphate synthase HpnD [Nitrosomonadaceae bacterium]|nr:presqualene diphosphate synthase HpnD [Nitrosospira sp.]MDW7642436.1 presqualene diphosphate synthase HpnD [Nitrosomonadaceae bacterium]MDW7653619.1 presqualene diphosphate synthase HpnD [Nitrosomonadaceae bacterium]MDW7663757.1 presqualene diphosphate synthase HpnD [Nitrosomonadaceae bacterium]
MTPDQYCQNKAIQSGSSFYYSFLYLPTEKRRAITALYAFCREVDDVVDECTDISVARIKLAWWRQEISSVFNATQEHRPAHPVAKALLATIKEIDLTAEQLYKVIDGMEMDLDYNRYTDFNTLKLYCHHVAGVVGELSAKIFGYRNDKTLIYAHNLGLAFQLTNIIRDIGEDARRGRIYLPQDELVRFGVSDDDILNSCETNGFRQLMEFQIERAEEYYDKAFAALPAEDRKNQLPGLIMAAIYRTLLEEIKNGGCQVMRQRVSLTPIRKLWIGWKTWVRG